MKEAFRTFHSKSIHPEKTGQSIDTEVASKCVLSLPKTAPRIRQPLVNLLDNRLPGAGRVLSSDCPPRRRCAAFPMQRLPRLLPSADAPHGLRQDRFTARPGVF